MKNTKLLRKIADLEKQVKEHKSQVERRDQELQNLKKQTQREKSHVLQRQDSYEKAVVSGTTKDQEIRALKRQLDNLQTVKLAGEERMFEISRKDKEIRQLKENIEQLRSRKSAAERDVANISEQAKHFEIQCCTEKEHSQRLQDKIKQLQQQLDIAPLPELDDKPSGGEDGSAKTIACLQSRIKLLTENVTKLKEHSLEQSRAVLSLRQQAEMSKVGTMTYYHVSSRSHHTLNDCCP